MELHFCIHNRRFKAARQLGLSDHRANVLKPIKVTIAVFVLHCYQKKSRRGAETPKSDVELINRRLKAAEELYEEMKRGGVL